MSPIAMAGARRDFVALAVMMGNDYLPGSRFGVKFSWEAYVALRYGPARFPNPGQLFYL
jgi:5'-3' exoribonuclease 1